MFTFSGGIQIHLCFTSSRGAINLYLGWTQEIWRRIEGLSEVGGESPTGSEGRSSSETEAACRHCLHNLTEETTEIKKFSHTSTPDYWQVCSRWGLNDILMLSLVLLQLRSPPKLRHWTLQGTSVSRTEPPGLQPPNENSWRRQWCGGATCPFSPLDLSPVSRVLNSTSKWRNM